MTLHRLTITLAVVLLSLLASTSFGADLTNNIFSATSGDWNTAANWDQDRAPTTTDDAYLRNGADVNINAAAGTVANVRVMDATLVLKEGGSITVPKSIMIGYGQAGTLNIEGGTGTIDRIDVGESTISAGGTSVMNVSGGKLQLGMLILNYHGNGEVNQTGGTISTRSNVYFNINANDFAGVYNLSGGTLEAYVIAFRYKAQSGTSGLNVTNNGVLRVSNIMYEANYKDDSPTFELNGGTLEPAAISKTKVEEVGLLSISHPAKGKCNFVVKSPKARLLMQIAGATKFDQISVNDTFEAGGILEIALLGYEPKVGDSFKLFTAGTYKGSFAEFKLPALKSGRWNTSAVANKGVVTVVADQASQPASAPSQSK